MAPCVSTYALACLVGAAVYDDAMTLVRGRSARTCFGGACPTVATPTVVGLGIWLSL
jgi:hypothetical protein